MPHARCGPRVAATAPRRPLDESHARTSWVQEPVEGCGGPAAGSWRRSGQRARATSAAPTDTAKRAARKMKTLGAARGGGTGWRRVSGEGWGAVARGRRGIRAEGEGRQAGGARWRLVRGKQARALLPTSDGKRSGSASHLETFRATTTKKGRYSAAAWADGGGEKGAESARHSGTCNRPRLRGELFSKGRGHRGGQGEPPAPPPRPVVSAPATPPQAAASCAPMRPGSAAGAYVRRETPRRRVCQRAAVVAGDASGLAYPENHRWRSRGRDDAVDVLLDLPVRSPKARHLRGGASPRLASVFWTSAKWAWEPALACVAHPPG